MKERVEELSNLIEGKTLEESLALVANAFPGKVRFSSAFGQEDQVITHAIFKHSIDIEVFTLDTGRLFPETYELIDRTRARYKRPIRVYYPKAEQVEELVTKKGMHSFYESVENRKECCYIRKVEPLKRALRDTAVWVTGLRADQSDNRQNFSLIEWDEPNQVIKFNPLLRWSYDEMLEYLKKHQVPYNPLHDKGYISIGCAPCTRAIEPGEHPRAGRWYWEASQKECGLHQVKQ
ncbi:phosphoadenylyl-sulfate reductase [Roseivirga thermotolerans]|uniref:Adenosine 5'-phosphosulfate reductase n=1 Tax=Roseivirga thermotolerans TaxID=1758176 RepID=A0ABQ3I5W4_9BACT|nr:phosphoadenylyl-sulfate reductase [Roseivirga thermotolerans]GHE65662.1 phosphoadenosine phosphosulfate reductase [Roseivirga thermotolerans]